MHHKMKKPRSDRLPKTELNLQWITGNTVQNWMKQLTSFRFLKNSAKSIAIPRGWPLGSPAPPQCKTWFSCIIYSTARYTWYSNPLFSLSLFPISFQGADNEVTFKIFQKSDWRTSPQVLQRIVSPGLEMILPTTFFSNSGWISL